MPFDPVTCDPEHMTRDQQEKFAESYAKVMNRNRAPKTPYHFPDTIEEQTAISREADGLRLRGNELYRSGELVEGAKLYEQAVHKFADWYAEGFATDEEKAVVQPVKLGAHANLAACSHRLGNHQHAIVHCTQVPTLTPTPRLPRALAHL